MKKFISTLLSLALVVGMLPAMIANAAIDGIEGAGTSESPYRIADADDLKAARDAINADTAGTGARIAYYELIANIDLKNDPWIPIAPYGSYPFAGSFDGKNHVISNVNVEVNADNATVDYTAIPALGFFGHIQGVTANTSYIGTVKNLGLKNVSVVNNARWISTGWKNKIAAIGAFAGTINRNATISGCFVKNATVANNATDQTTSNGVGGFFASSSLNIPDISNCYIYDATVTSACSNGADKVGGFFANGAAAIKLTNCYAAKTVTTAASKALTTFYGFGAYSGVSSSTVINNCCSESDDMPGERADLGVYNSTLSSQFTTGMTKAGLVEAMTDAEYATDATINDGYPCLEWELPEDTLTGSGTESDPYMIESASDLKDARDLINANANGAAAAYYELAADIVLDANETWIPIAPLEAVPFTGTFDGKNHTISNITAVRTNGNKNDFGTKPALGFFGRIHAGGTVKNLGLNNVQAVNEFTGYSNKTTGIGGLAGYIKGAVIISNCYVKNVTLGNVQRDQRQTMGGFIGTVGGSTPELTNCYVYGLTINSSGTTESDSFGGFIGPASGVAMKNTNCYVADVTLNIADASTSSFYAFGTLNTGSSSYAEVNCFSDATDIAKTAYDADKSAGEVGQTMADIAGVFNSLEGWQDGTNINAGYPALAWETAPVVVAADPYVVKQVSLAKGTVTLTVNNATAGDQVCIAAYDSNDRLVAAEFKAAAATVTTTVASSADVAKVKVFVWNGLTPVINAVDKDLY